MGADIIELGSEETTAPAPPPPPTGVILSTRAGYKQGAQVRLFASEMQTPTVCGQ